MNDNREVQLPGNLQLGGESASLLGVRREIVMIIQARLADRHDLLAAGKLSQLGDGLARNVLGVVRMDANRRIQSLEPLG